jgi:NO-binding membrane sensor protein with MHYT domain
MNSLALAAATHLPWFGSATNDGVEPHYSAVSGFLVPPGSPAGVVPGTQNWGYLIVAVSMLLAVSAAATAAVCAFSRRFRDLRTLSHALAAVATVSALLVAVVALEFVPRVPFDGPATLGFDWGTILGTGLAVLSSIAAWFAWATVRYPHRWGQASTF